jgi:hypothetical protein
MCYSTKKSTPMFIKERENRSPLPKYVEKPKHALEKKEKKAEPS